jgi:lysozyme family protein
MISIPLLVERNAARWAECEILSARLAEVQRVAHRLVAPLAKARYLDIAEATGVPWFVIAVIHEREASQDFNTQLGQGDPLHEVSRHVPRGRGPFFAHSGHDAFYWGALDALEKCPPQAAHWRDWSAGGTLTLLETYNGLGYESYHAEPSPYLWGATNQEREGKYVKDGIWSASTWDTQIGAAALLKVMGEFDSSVKFSEELRHA